MQGLALTIDPGQSFVITQAAIDALAQLVNALDWGLIYGLNLARGTPEQQEEAAYVTRAVGPSFGFWHEADQLDVALPGRQLTQNGLRGGWLLWPRLENLPRRCDMGSRPIPIHGARPARFTASCNSPELLTHPRWRAFSFAASQASARNSLKVIAASESPAYSSTASHGASCFRYFALKHVPRMATRM